MRRYLGEKVARLELREWYGADNHGLAIETAGNVRQLLSLLPNLRHFVYNSSLPHVPFTPTVHSVSRHLAHVSLSTPIFIENRSLDLGNLEWLNLFPTLTSVEVVSWWIDIQSPATQDHVFPRIGHLTIEGPGAAEPSVAVLVNACSSLVKLKLDSSGMDDFRHTLPLLRPKIESLCLGGPEDSESIDFQLSRFTHLTTLELPYCQIASNKLSTLLNLPNLVNLVLGNSEVEVSALLPLIEGQDRLPHLKRITLNDEHFEIHGRFDPTDEYSKNPFRERNDYPLFAWTPIPWGDPSQRWRDLVNLQLVGRRNGVMIEGIGGAEQGLRDYALEKHNLAIAQVYYHFDFSYIYEAIKLATLHDFQLPSLGIDLFNRNLDEVELVKVEMEEYGSFALTLRNKEP